MDTGIKPLYRSNHVLSHKFDIPSTKPYEIYKLDTFLTVKRSSEVEQKLGILKSTLKTKRISSSKCNIPKVINS